MPGVLKMDDKNGNDATKGNDVNTFAKACDSCRQAVRGANNPPTNINEYVVSVTCIPLSAYLFDPNQSKRMGVGGIPTFIGSCVVSFLHTNVAFNN